MLKACTGDGRVAALLMLQLQLKGSLEGVGGSDEAMMILLARRVSFPNDHCLTRGLKCGGDF